MTGRRAWTRILCAIVVAALVCPPAFAADEGSEDDDRPDRPDGTASMLASAAYPGLGQLLNGTEKKAAIMSAAEIALIAGLVVEDRRTRNSFRLYKQTGELRYYDEYSEHFDNRQTLIWWVVVAALYGLADAYVDAHLVGFDDIRPSFVEGEFGPTGDDGGGVRLALAVRF